MADSNQGDRAAAALAGEGRRRARAVAGAGRRSRRRTTTRSWSGSRPRRSTRPTSACCSAPPTSPPPRSSGAGDDAMVTAKIPPQFMRAHDRAARGPVAAGRQRGRGRGGRRRARRRPGAGRQDRRHPRRRHVRPVPGGEGGRLRCCCTTTRRPRDGASCFVNPLTALGMVGTMRLEGHTALVHTAAASNLGQMLVKICLADGVAAGEHRAQPRSRRRC